jgi:lipopolysaccharide export system protein LptA
MSRTFSLCIALVAAAVSAPAFAQAPRPAATSPLQNLGQGQSQQQPVQIEAATLEVHDKTKTATFSGNVQVVQGDTTMKCQSLIVFYGPEAGGNATSTPVTATTAKPAAGMPAAGMPQGSQSIRRIEARGGVTVLTKDQNASGDLGVYDLKSRTITLSGNVVVSQGQNVIHGERVVVDTVTGNARVESGSSNGGAGAGAPGPGRVRALIQPGKGQNGSESNFMTLGPGKQN